VGILTQNESGRRRVTAEHIYRQPDSNELATARQIRKTMAELAKDFPPGVAYDNQSWQALPIRLVGAVVSENRRKGRSIRAYGRFAEMVVVELFRRGASAQRMVHSVQNRTDLKTFA
jgi:hypothetical protein